MKLHFNLVNAVASGLTEIFHEGGYADKVIERLLKSNPLWGARDRGFIAENIYECVRWWRLLWFINESRPEFDNESLVRIIGINIILKGHDLPDWKEFQGLSHHSVKNKLEKAEKDRRIIESVPDWMDEVCTKELGKVWEEEIHALNNTAQVVIRANTLKIKRNELQERLDSENYTSHTSKLSETALVLDRRANIFRSELFKNGYFEIQDAGSQAIAPFLRVEPGMRVIDACAGAGGKTLHLACLMKNKGRIIALDTEEWKLKELQKRARRNGVDIVETRLIEGNKTIKRLENSADRLLLDVPCSGLGVLKRNPDAKWKLSKSFIDEIKETQEKIINEYSSMLKPGGLMVYATCSILPSENEQQVQKFLEKNKGKFELVKDQRLSPAKDGFDGFYMALIRKMQMES